MIGGLRSGVTLVELIVAIAITSIMAASVAALLQAALQAEAYASTKQSLHREAFQIITRMATGLKSTSQVFVPNGHSTSRPLLIFSANLNDDNDFYRGSDLFPRIDEDTSADMTDDTASGVQNIDDDGNGITDDLIDLLLGANNDDEDSSIDEDRWDGADNDGDGTIDEDVSANMGGDGVPGVSGMDDDWDGTVDEGAANDDDEDGVTDEDHFDPLIYSYNSGTQTLTEKLVATNTTTTLSTVVSAFSATYEASDATHGPRFLLTLSLSSGGQTVTLSEYVFPRNITQKSGKRVR